jgi:hypothetical protein
MANKKITDLDALVLMQNTDLFVAYDLPNLATKKISLAGVWNSLKTSVIASDDITWAQVNKTGSDLDDLATKNAVDLQATGPDVLLGRTSSGTGDVETVTCTAFARSILDDEDADEVIETLGLDVTADEVSYALTGWYKVDSDLYTAALPDKYYDSTIKACDTWGALETYTAGDIVIPAVGTGFLYLCLVGGTSDSSEPTFPTTPGETVADNDVIWACILKHVIDIDANFINHKAYKANCAIKAKVGSDYFYGRIYTTGASEIVVKFAGAFTGDIDELYIGLDKVRMLNIHRAGNYNASSDDDILIEAYGYCFEAGFPTALYAMDMVHDSTGHSKLGLTVSGIAVYEDALMFPVQDTFSWSYGSLNNVVSISGPAALNFDCNKWDATGDAEDLSVMVEVILL